jgi:cell division protein FtsN
MSDKPSLYVVEKKEVVILVILFVLVTVLSFTMGVRYGEAVGKKSAREQVVAETEAGSEEAETIGGRLQEDSPEAAVERKADPYTPSRASEKPAPQPDTREVVERDSDEFLLNALKEAGVEPPGGKAPQEAKLPQEVKVNRSGTWVVQVGSHPTRSEAENHVRLLKGKNVEAEIMPPFQDRQGQWHRVVVGKSFKTKREAEREAAQLKDGGAIISFFVWRLP